MPLDLVGSNWDALNVTVSSADTEITYPKQVKSFAYWSRNQKKFTVKRLSTDSKFITMNEGERLDSKVLFQGAYVATNNLGFVTISDGSSEVIEGIVTF